jgi:hypothetical protein
MSEIELIEKQVERLDDKSLAQFRDWFITYEHARLDHKLEVHSAAVALNSAQVVGLAEVAR